MPSVPRIDNGPISMYQEPFLRPPPRPPDVKTINRKDLQESDMDRKLEFEENLPHQEGIISEIYERSDKSFIPESPELNDFIDTPN